jgi:hypothetical protein
MIVGNQIVRSLRVAIENQKALNSMLGSKSDPTSLRVSDEAQAAIGEVDAYFSADVETDGPIPGPFSILSFAIVYAGRFDGEHFLRPQRYDRSLYKELKPISDNFQPDALRVNKLDRARLCIEGELPGRAMTEASRWVRSIAGSANPVLVAYPLSFDWSWLYWYFIRYSDDGSPFGYSRCFDIKTALAVKAGIPIASSARSRLHPSLRSARQHTHHALDDAIEQAEIFGNVFEWKGRGE